MLKKQLSGEWNRSAKSRKYLLKSTHYNLEYGERAKEKHKTILIREFAQAYIMRLLVKIRREIERFRKPFQFAFLLL